MRILLICLPILIIAFKGIDQEILSFNSARINGTLASATTKENLLKTLGRPSKIEDFNPEMVCALTEAQEKAKQLKWYYFDSTKFLIYDQVADIVEINFRNGKITYKTPQINLSNKTTLQQLRKIFPKAVAVSLKENAGT